MIRFLTAPQRRDRSRVRLFQTQRGLCALCGKPMSDCHEIVSIKGLNHGSKYRQESAYAHALYRFENCLGLCNWCNLNAANSKSVKDMIELKMSLPGVSPIKVVAAMRRLASYSKKPRQHLPKSVEYKGTTYTILQ